MMQDSAMYPAESGLGGDKAMTNGQSAPDHGSHIPQLAAAWHPAPWGELDPSAKLPQLHWNDSASVGSAWGEVRCRLRLSAFEGIHAILISAKKGRKI